MRTQVDEIDRSRPGPEQVGRQVRHEDLTTVADGHDSCGAVEGPASVIAADELNLAGVQAHAHPWTTEREMLLRLDGRGRGRARRAERGGHAVAHGGEDHAARLRHRSAENVEMAFDHLGHLGGLLPAGRRPLHVGEEEGVGRTGPRCVLGHTLVRSFARCLAAIEVGPLLVVDADHGTDTADRDTRRHRSSMRTKRVFSTYVCSARALRRALHVPSRRACDRSGRGECRRFSSRSTA